MQVTVKLFARLRDVTGAAEMTREVQTGASIRDVWNGLVEDHADLAPYTRIISCARNAEYAKFDARVDAGDDIAFLPPVSGG